MNKLSAIMSILFVLFISQAVNAAGPAPVNLGTAGNFVILSKSGITNTGTTSIVGDIGVSPIAASGITGFGLIMDASMQFSTSSLVTGKVYASDYATPTPTMMTTAVSDMEAAYSDAAGRTNPTAVELGAGNIGGRTLAPGLYKWSTGVTIPTDLTLSGGPSDVWIFQIAQTLDVGNGVVITLSGGAQPQNIFWQVGSQATLETTSDVKGIILSKDAIVMKTGAKLNGRALSQKAVILDSNAAAPTGTTPPLTGCQYNNPSCSTEQQCINNNCITTPTTCWDGTENYACSETHEYCSNGTLVDNASVCGCPSGLVASGDSCITPTQTPAPEFPFILVPIAVVSAAALLGYYVSRKQN
jgi:hypothetical protein